MNAMWPFNMNVNYELFIGLFGEFIDLVITTMTAFTGLTFRENIIRDEKIILSFCRFLIK